MSRRTKKKAEWEFTPKPMKGCIRKVLDLCRKTSKLQSEIAYDLRRYKIERVDDRMIKLRPEEIEP